MLSEEIGKFQVFGSALLLLLSLGAPASGQGTPASKDTKASASEEAPVKPLAADAVTVTPPAGWTRGRSPRGTQLLLRPANKAPAQIEIKGTPGMSPRQAKVFFRSFHVNLQRAGADRAEASKDRTIGDRKGRWTRYAIEASGGDYELIVFEYVEVDVAWLFVAFLQKKEIDAQRKAFEEVVSRAKIAERGGE